MSQDALYEEVSTAFSAALERLARSYEADTDRRRDLLQEIHFAIWRSLAAFASGCSLRTWVYRVAHNVAASHVLKSRRARRRTWLSLDQLEATPGHPDPAALLERRMTLDQLYHLVQDLQPVDRVVILLYLEGLQATAIAEVTGISPANVATKIHRIKKILRTQFTEGGSDER
jgi:RNA polymerase sigma-70 factor, ECF subfamily